MALLGTNVLANKYFLWVDGENVQFYRTTDSLDLPGTKLGCRAEYTLCIHRDARNISQLMDFNRAT